ncbi:MAG: uroporphyrinogen-III C-methyltransferase [Candidatus Microbacterium colombiense]|nr:MAG: uroporphyrinogen-III C-methyltransferase [Microbacterium sp.]
MISARGLLGHWWSAPAGQRPETGAGIGRVDLIGGGPGPADLMTMRAHRLLAQADVVVVDRLGPAEELRAGLAPHVLVIDVGKSPGHHPVPQTEINALLVSHARAGKRVVRLKGGDPFVFGRGGEEVIACEAAGVPVTVTPGVSSAIAVPQAAGIPVTHRGMATALHVVNGHSPLSASALASLVDPEVTTIVLMGVTMLPRIVAAGLAFGARADLPAAVIENGHSAQQRTIRSTLGRLAVDAAAARVTNPAVIVIGEVARDGLLLPAPEQFAASLA